MKSKFEIEKPFTDRFDCAYKVSSQGRNTVVLYSTVTKKRLSVSYARYLMSVHLGRYLTEDEHVDHRNDIKDDDRIDNLQILTQEENTLKHTRLRGRQMVEYECPVCAKVFSRRRKDSHFKSYQNGKSVCCSRSCGARAGSKPPERPIRFLREYNWYDEN